MRGEGSPVAGSICGAQSKREWELGRSRAAEIAESSVVFVLTRAQCRLPGSRVALLVVFKTASGEVS